MKICFQYRYYCVCFHIQSSMLICFHSPLPFVVSSSMKQRMEKSGFYMTSLLFNISVTAATTHDPHNLITIKTIKHLIFSVTNQTGSVDRRRLTQYFHMQEQFRGEIMFQKSRRVSEKRLIRFRFRRVCVPQQQPSYRLES